MKIILFFLLISFAVCLGTIITDGPFELDGNAVSSTKDDWSTLVNGGGSARSFSGIVSDPAPFSIFTTGGSKDPNQISQWKYTNGSVPDKDQLLDAYAAVYTYNGQVYLYFGTDRYGNDGDSTIGFWFFKNNVALGSGGSFTGTHSNGDVLILANFGSSTETIIYQWNNGNVVLLYDNLNARCTAGATQSACFIFNSQTIPSPWSYVPKSGTSGNFPPTSFMEGGIVLNDFFQEIPCFSSFLAVSRSSSSLTATLKDFVLNGFNSCKLDVTLDCVNTTVDDTKTLFVYTFKITVNNSGFGKLYNVVITYNGQQVATVAQLDVGQQYSYFGQFTSATNPASTGAVSVTAYADVALTQKLTGTADPTTCPPLSVQPSIFPTISCNGLNINQDTEQFEYSFSGSIANTGFGVQTLQSAVVNYNGNQQSLNLQGTVLNPVVSPTSVSFNGVIKTTSVVNSISLTVVSQNYLNTNAQYTTSAATCPPVVVDPSLSLTKSCQSSLVLLNSTLVVKVHIDMTVCNTGDIKLTSVSLVDHIQNFNDVIFSTLNLLKNTCRNFVFDYYPTQANAQLTFSDTLTATAQAILNLGTATATVSATCGLCPG